MAIVVPLITSAFFCYLVQNQLGYKQFEANKNHQLPQKINKQLLKYKFAYTPDNEVTQALATKIFQNLGVDANNIIKFKNNTEMKKHFIDANIVPLFQNKTQQFKNDLLKHEIISKDFDNQLFDNFIKTDYKQYLEIDNNSQVQQQILFGLDFDLNDTKVNYTLHYNREIIENHHRNVYDAFLAKILPYSQNTFSHVGFILQQAIEEELIKYTAEQNNISYKKKRISISPLTLYESFQVPESQAFLLSYMFPTVAICILLQIIIAEVRSQYYNMVKKLGGSDVAFWSIMFIFSIFLATTVIYFQMVVSRQFSINPFSNFSLDVLLLFSFLASLPVACTCCFVGVVVENQISEIIVTIVLNMLFVIIALFASVTNSQFNNIYSSVWDDNYVPQKVIWLLYAILPPFSYYVMSDYWPSVTFKLVNQDKNYSNEYYHLKDLFNYALYDLSGKTAKPDGHPFYIPRIDKFISVVLVQVVVFYFFVIYLSQVLNQTSYVGMPWYFLFDKRFYTRKNNQREDDQEQLLEKNTLQLKHVSKSFSNISSQCQKLKKLIIENINFEVQNGQVIGLMGCTGSGKTTLCKIIQHQLQGDTGTSIQYGGIELSGPYASLHRNIVSSCPQDKSNIMFNASIKDNITVCRDYIKWNADQLTLDQYIDLLLEKLKLKQHQNKTYYQLSGGMQRRLSLLISLLRIPDILILDEITANVDPQLKHDVWDILQIYQQLFHRIIILTSHDSYELQYICSYVIHIDKQKIQHKGYVGDIIQKHLTSEMNNQLSLNEIIYQNLEKEENDQRKVSTTDTRDLKEKLQLSTQFKQHHVNSLQFQLRKRWFWHLNSKCGVLIFVILFNLFVGVVNIMFSSGNNKIPPKPFQEQEMMLYMNIVNQKNISQRQFQQTLIDDSMNMLNISTEQPLHFTTQMLKDAFQQDQKYGQQLTFGDYSALLGISRLHEQQTMIVVNQTNLSVYEQYDGLKTNQKCQNITNLSSSIQYKCEDVENNLSSLYDNYRPKIIPQIVNRENQYKLIPQVFYINNLKQALRYASDNRLGKQYLYNFSELSTEQKIAKNVGNALAIVQEFADQVVYHINTPPIQIKYDKFTDMNLVLLQYQTANFLPLPDFPQASVINRHFIVNYHNDVVTRFNAKRLRDIVNKNIIFQANFIQQPQYYSHNETSRYFENAYSGELVMSYFTSLILGLYVLFTSFNYYNDANSVLRNQLEAISMKKVKLFLSQIVVDSIQLSIIMLTFLIQQQFFHQIPQYLYMWQLYFALLLIPITYAMLLNIYAIIFKHITSFILFMAVIFMFSLYTVAFIDIEFEMSMIINLFVPGYYYMYLAKQSGKMLNYGFQYLIYGLLVQATEIVITCIILHFTGRKYVQYKPKNQQLLLNAENVGASYGKTKILQNVTMKLQENDQLALIGNNGCGKTTFIKCVLHQLKHSGTLENINEIAIVPQDDIVFHGLTVRQYFQSIGTYNTQKQLIQEMNLEECLDTKYSQLSGGQQRRLTIALILSTNPRVTMLDEITVGSDHVMKRAIWSKLNAIVSTKIVISHDMGEILQHSKKICFVKHGKGKVIEEKPLGWIFIVYDKDKQSLMDQCKFNLFFDKYSKQIDTLEEFKQIYQTLITNKVLFTYEENGLEKLFIEDYEYQE